MTKKNRGNIYTYNKSEKFCIVSIEEFFELWEKAANNHKKTFLIKDKIISTSSKRYKIFKKSIKCLNCGIKGKYFKIERQNTPFNKTGKCYANLYAIDNEGREILMTKDHIVPLFKNGKNHIDNLQTLCIVCNQTKGNK